ncbi:MAG: Unknown protein [uncultured Sulfurovum sp.]|uniref:Antitoxin n=1 Tax=uncultured Sulfurovum sp. TaxID=269237 RepID=A0A6S6SD67_9BACT|nr:MAG: Unknown protein [uncultured Sulfurovum sp.]
MTSKITLYSESDLIEQIKIYAKEQNTSVSKIVNEFFTNLLETSKDNQDTNTNKKSKITDTLVGVIAEAKAVDIVDYKKHLEEKYQ